MFFDELQKAINSNMNIVVGITSLSIISFVGSLILIPYIIVNMPSDYFIISRMEFINNRIKHPILRVIVHFMKNFMGTLFFAAGVIMLFIPGQGLLTMLIGLSLIDFPFKKELELKIISKRSILKFVNKLRHKAGKESLILK